MVISSKKGWEEQEIPRIQKLSNIELFDEFVELASMPDCCSTSWDQKEKWTYMFLLEALNERLQLWLEEK